MALTDAAGVKAWVAGNTTQVITGVDDTVLGRCIAAAGETIVDETSRIWEKATIAAEYFNGDRAAGANKDTLILRRFPVIYAPPTDAITVSENGVALTVAQGYSTSADVIVENVGLEQRGNLVRRLQPWASGRQNIVVSYPAGYTTPPARIRYVAEELSWLMYQEGRKVGVDQVTQAGAGRTLVHGLSQMSRDILAKARRW